MVVRNRDLRERSTVTYHTDSYRRGSVAASSDSAGHASRQEFIASDKLRDHVEPVTRNVTLVDKSEDATRYQMSDQRIFNGGVGLSARSSR